MDDSISRQVVKEQMLRYGFTAPDMTVTEFIEDLPSAQPKRGKWIPWKYHDGFRCEYCNEPVNNKHNFCPNCGADMRGEKR